MERTLIRVVLTGADVDAFDKTSEHRGQPINHGAGRACSVIAASVGHDAAATCMFMR